MDDVNTNLHKRRHLISFTALLLTALIAGALNFWEQSSKPDNPGSLAKAKTITIPKHSTPQKAEGADTKVKPVASKKPQPAFALAQEIEDLNAGKCPAFTTNFGDGHSSPKKIDNYLTSGTNRYVIDLQKNSFLSTPTYHDSSLYISGGFSSRAFFAFNAFTGKLRWGVDLSDDGPSSAVFSDSAILFNTESCTVFALNPKTGEQLWAKWIGDPLMSSPVTDGKNLYTAYPARGLYKGAHQPDTVHKFKPSHAFAAFDANTGEVKWQTWLNGDVMTTPVLHGNEIYLSTFSGSVYRLDAKTGKILAAQHIKATSLPTVYNNKIIITKRVDNGSIPTEAFVLLNRYSLQEEKVFAEQLAPYLDYKLQKRGRLSQKSAQLDAANGFAAMPLQSGYEKARDIIGLANVSSLQSYLGSTAVVKDHYMFSAFGNKIVCYNLTDLKEVWSYEVPGDALKSGGRLCTAPIIAGVCVITATTDGNILVLDQYHGTLRTSYDLKTEIRNQPIAVKGYLFVPTADGKLVSINTKTSSIDGWPMFMKNNSHNTTMPSLSPSIPVL